MGKLTLVCVSFPPGAACDGEDHARVLVRERRCATDGSPYQENPVSTQRGRRHENLNANTTFRERESVTLLGKTTCTDATTLNYPASLKYFRPLRCDGAYLTPPPKLLNLR